MREQTPSGRTISPTAMALWCWNQTVTHPSASESAKYGRLRARSLSEILPRRHHAHSSSTAGSMTTEVFASSARRKKRQGE